ILATHELPLLDAFHYPRMQLNDGRVTFDEIRDTDWYQPRREAAGAEAYGADRAGALGGRTKTGAADRDHDVFVGRYAGRRCARTEIGGGVVGRCGARGDDPDPSRRG